MLPLACHRPAPALERRSKPTCRSACAAVARALVAGCPCPACLHQPPTLTASGRCPCPLAHPPRRWPFAAGFAFTSYIMIKVATSVTDEDVKNSKFANPKH